MVGRIASPRVQSLLRLVGEVSETADDQARRRQLGDGLCRLVNAQVIVHAEVGEFWRGGRVSVRSIDDGGWATESDRRGLVAAFVAGGGAVDPAISAFAVSCPRLTTGDVRTVRRSEVVDDASWYGSGYVNDCLRPARIDDGVYSAQQRPERGAVHGLALWRPANDRPFSTEDRDLVQLVHEQWDRLWRERSGPTPSRPLRPRERETLDVLLGGATEKDAAAELGVSRHTVHQYVKAIYEAYGVTSRAELLALFVR
jgi:DNA-binding CsgD family transcriptional regulator